MSSSIDVEKLCRRVADTHEKAWTDFLEGEDGALTFLVGQALQRTGGRADPGKVGREFKRMKDDER